jgi:hypothetical protein
MISDTNPQSERLQGCHSALELALEIFSDRRRRRDYGDKVASAEPRWLDHVWQEYLGTVVAVPANAERGAVSASTVSELPRSRPT